MDYLNIPRSLIYKEHTDLKDFGVQIPDTISNLLFMKLKQQAFMGIPKAKEVFLRCYNNAYYICTIILLEADDFPELRASDYVDKILEIEKDKQYIDDVCLASMAMASLLLEAYDEKRFGRDSDLWKAIYFRCTHYQWYSSMSTVIFKSLMSVEYCFVAPLLSTEFAPRDIVEAIEEEGKENPYLLERGIEYICERLSCLDDSSKKSYGVDLVLKHLNKSLQETYESYGYNPKTKSFEPAEPGTIADDPDFRKSFYDDINPIKKAKEYIIEYKLIKEQNDSKEKTEASAQKQEIEELQTTIREQETKLSLQETKLAEANKINAQQAQEIKGLVERVIQLQEEIRKISETDDEDKNDIPEQAFNASGNECFTKAKMGLLIYTIASITDGPTPIKTRLAPIISAIGGWNETSVNSEIRKAGFNQKDIDAVANVFESAMPKFASDIRKQIPRRGKTKK